MIVAWHEWETTPLPQKLFPSGFQIAHGDTQIDLNRGTYAELVELPGIGPVIAKRILSHRMMHGPFFDTREILDIKGIGEKSYARIKDLISVCKSSQCSNAISD